VGLQEGKRDPCLKVLSGNRHLLLESLLNTCAAWIIGTSNFRHLVAEGKTYHHKCLCVSTKSQFAIVAISGEIPPWLCLVCDFDHESDVVVLLSLLLCLPQFPK